MQPEAAPATDPASLLSLALDAGVETPADPASERILDAALALVGEGGLRAVSMDRVAARAGVGRMTVYRRFGERARLVQALAVRETRRGLAGVAAAQADPRLGAADRIAEGFVAALRVAREEPFFARMPALEVLGALNQPGEETVQMVRDFIAGFIREGQARGELRDVDAEIAAELLLRLGVSFLLIPRSTIPLADPDAARTVARTMIAPIVAG